MFSLRYLRRCASLHNRNKQWRHYFTTARRQVGALILSSFEEVLLLDSDNVPLENPDTDTDAQNPMSADTHGHGLFGSEAYLRAGAVLWPDYWRGSAAPDLFEIAPELAGKMARGATAALCPYPLFVLRPQCFGVYALALLGPLLRGAR